MPLRRLNMARGRISSFLRTRRARLKEKLARFWRRHLRKPFRGVIHWWIVWVSLIGTIAFYALGRFLLLDGQPATFSRIILDSFIVKEVGDFHINVLVEIIGLFMALGIAWLLIERHSQRQSQRIREGVKARISDLRNHVTWPITSTTTAIYEVPPFQESARAYGFAYLKENYQDLRNALDEQIPDRFFKRQGGRINGWFWIMEQYEQVASMCHETIRLYGPGLVEYPELLSELETVERRVAQEKVQWDKFNSSIDDRRRRDREDKMLEMQLGHPLEPPSLDHDILPKEAIANFRMLARRNLSLIIVISAIIGDWSDLPSETISRYEAFWGNWSNYGR